MSTLFTGQAMKTQNKPPNHSRVLAATPHGSRKWQAVAGYRQPAWSTSSCPVCPQSGNKCKRHSSKCSFSRVGIDCWITVQSDQRAGIVYTQRHSEKPHFRHTCGYMDKGVAERLSVNLEPYQLCILSQDQWESDSSFPKDSFAEFVKRLKKCSHHLLCCCFFWDVFLPK